MTNPSENPNPFDRWGQKSWLNLPIGPTAKPETKTKVESSAPSSWIFFCLGAISSVALLLVGVLAGTSRGGK
jgi:hypothetical protein